MSPFIRNLQSWALDSPLFPAHMSFILGPRQVGKTTLARNWAHSNGFGDQYYLNFDQTKVRRQFSTQTNWLDQLRADGAVAPLLIDEIHKMRSWKRSLKGVYDTFKDDFFFVITGSGRLDAFQRGGDSLAGRYDAYQLFPLTPGELERLPPAQEINLDTLLASTPIASSVLESWLSLGGFPEPFLAGSRAKMLRWWEQYSVRVTEEDMRDLTALQSVDLMKQLIEILPHRVGSPLSINAVREDLETSFATAKRYIRNLAQLFLTFEVPAYHHKIHRAVKKEKKLYFFNHAIIEDPGHRLENAVALGLSKWVTALNEQALGPMALWYLRDQDRREVDFLITKKGKPHLLLEVKQSDLKPTTAGLYYHNKLNVPFVQIVGSPGIKRKTEFGAILSAHYLFSVSG